MAISAPGRAALVACVALRLGAAVDGQPDRAGVVARMGAYVDAWEIELGSVVADETYRQAVTRLPRSGVVRDRSAAFNLGSIARDINLPTFALAALRTVNQPRFRFATPRTEKVDGESLARIDFRERARPTLVSGAGGRDVPLQGTVWLETAGSRVRRTEILLRDRIIATPGGAAEEERMRDEELASRISVVFGPDAGVGAWVPIDMRERYDNAWGDVTTGHATYTNYRRFRTAGRLIRPE